MTTETPERRAASALFEILSEESEDALEEAYEETWTNGDYLDALEANHPGLEAHREATFRAVLGELAAMCLERSRGPQGNGVSDVD